MQNLSGKSVLVTGGARRIGRLLVLAAARAGADIVLHYNQSQDCAEAVRAEVQSLGRKVHLVQADLGNPEEATTLIERALDWGPLFSLINNAAIFEPAGLEDTDIKTWNRHLMINLTAPFLLSQAFALSIPPGAHGRIINILDWRALRPGTDHLAYTISKAGLAALTRSLAQSLSPEITVNGLALGAILPPEDRPEDRHVLRNTPAARWATLEELEQTILFLLEGPAYINGEIIHLDGGRHVV